MENIEEIIKKMREECECCPYLGEYDCKADPYIDGCYKENKKAELTLGQMKRETKQEYWEGERMEELEKVSYGLRCMCYGDVECKECDYAKDGSGWHDCRSNCANDALDLLKEQAGTGYWEWIEEDKYRCSECNNTTYVDECMEEPQYLFCPYCGHKMTWAGR